jgi:hypothetical protein
VGRGKPIILDHISFSTKKAAIAYFQELLARHDVEDELTEDSSDYRDVRALLDRHPDCSQKVGCGIRSFIIRLDANRNKMFWLRRLDDTETDFSFYSCVNGKGPSLRQEFAEAARMSVFPEIKAHKERYFRERANGNGMASCEETGRLMTIAEAHVDHHPTTFDQIVESFLETQSIVPSRAILSAPADNQTTTTFICPETERRFLEFHRQQARLLVVHKSVNLGRKRS